MKTIYLIFTAFAIIATATSQPTDYLPQNIKSLVAVGNLKQQEVSADLFKQQPGLSVNAPKDSPANNIIIVGYNYMRSHPKSKITEFTVKGADFSSNILEDIAQAMPGDVVLIDDIRVSFPDGNIRKLPSIIYKLI